MALQLSLLDLCVSSMTEIWSPVGCKSFHTPPLSVELQLGTQLHQRPFRSFLCRDIFEAKKSLTSDLQCFQHRVCIFALVHRFHGFCANEKVAGRRFECGSTFPFPIHLNWNLHSTPKESTLPTLHIVLGRWGSPDQSCQRQTWNKLKLSQTSSNREITTSEKIQLHWKMTSAMWTASTWFQHSRILFRQMVGGYLR